MDPGALRNQGESQPHWGQRHTVPFSRVRCENAKGMWGEPAAAVLGHGSSCCQLGSAGSLPFWLGILVASTACGSRELQSCAQWDGVWETTAVWASLQAVFSGASCKSPRAACMPFCFYSSLGAAHTSGETLVACLQAPHILVAYSENFRCWPLDSSRTTHTGEAGDEKPNTFMVLSWWPAHAGAMGQETTATAQPPGLGGRL